MHRDHKVGLAFGILLLGTVAAFFFRNETQQDDAIPELENAAELDAEIRTLPRHPEVQLDPRIQSVADDNSDPMGFNEMFPPLDSQGFAEPPPQPIPPAGSSNGVTPQPISPHHTAYADEPSSLDHESTDGDRRYEVRKGDTLSGLSIRFLGSATRFSEIYALNRDVMSSPDALRPGMVLRIPKRRRSLIPADVAEQERPRPSANGPARSTSVSTPTNRPVPTATSSLTNREALNNAVANNAVKTDRRPTASHSTVSDNPPVSRPQNADTRNRGSHFVPYGRSPLGFGGPFVESPGVLDAPPPPTQLKPRSQAFSEDPVQFDPIELPQFVDELPRRPNSTPSSNTGSQPRTAPTDDLRNASATTLPATRKYKVRAGDKLERLAIKYYGNRNAVRAIINANPELIRDPNRLRAGSTIVLP